MQPNSSKSDPPHSNADSVAHRHELASAALDGELTPEEQAELQGLSPQDQNRIAVFQTDGRRIGNALRGIRVQPVETSFRQSVMAELQKHVVTPASSALTPRHSPRSHSSRFVMVATSMLVLCAVLMVSLKEPLPERRSQRTPLDHTNASGLVASLPTGMAPAVFQQERHRVVMDPTSDWEIVRIRLPLKSRDEALQLIAEAADSSGLTVAPGVEVVRHSTDSFGVILTSATELEDRFAAELQNAASIKGSPVTEEKQQLIETIRHAMATPTLSELHFGEVYLLVPAVKPSEDPVASAEQSSSVPESGEPGSGNADASIAVADSEQAAAATGNAVTSVDSASSAQERSGQAVNDLAVAPPTASAAPGHHRVILVVFELDGEQAFRTTIPARAGHHI
ncbi:MAG: hypothetical protein KDA96_22395 [Planctomycetaceae bacterium]|nr:hypothetical protein [Planctomycetaceae bacterium]